VHGSVQQGAGTVPDTVTADDAVFSFKKAADLSFSVYAGEYAGITLK